MPDEITPDQEHLIDRYKHWQEQGKEEWFKALFYATVDDCTSLRDATDRADAACAKNEMPDTLKQDVERKSAKKVEHNK